MKLERGQRDERIVVAARHPALRLARGVPQQRRELDDASDRLRTDAPAAVSRGTAAAPALLNVDAQQIVRVVAGNAVGSAAADQEDVASRPRTVRAQRAAPHLLPLRVRIEDAQ